MVAAGSAGCCGAAATKVEDSDSAARIANVCCLGHRGSSHPTSFTMLPQDERSVHLDRPHGSRLVTTRNTATNLALGLAAIAAICVSPTSAAQIDHVILGIDDLDRGVKAFEKPQPAFEARLRRQASGRHSQRAGVARRRDVPRDPRSSGRASHRSRGFCPPRRQLKTLTPIGWAVSSNDTAQSAQASQRCRHRGERTGWRLAHYAHRLHSCPGNPSFSMRALRKCHSSSSGPNRLLTRRPLHRAVASCGSGVSRVRV